MTVETTPDPEETAADLAANNAALQAVARPSRLERARAWAARTIDDYADPGI